MLLQPYVNSKTGHAARCATGHECYPIPNSVQQGKGICKVCAGLDPATAEAAFRAAMADLGAVVLGEYRNAHTRVYVLCRAGHECYPAPHSVQQGDGICITCAGRDPAAAEAAFLKRLAELGATPLYERWQGAAVGHRLLCAAGHESYSRPSDVRKGDGVCRTCAGKDPRVAEAAFRARLADLGAELLEPYVNRKTPLSVVCAAGHVCRPTPGAVMAGGGICRTCAGQDPVVAEARFRGRLAELGAELLEPYINSVTPHHLRCAGSHDLYLRPGQVETDRKKGRDGICVYCDGKGPGTAEAAFRSRLGELGATLLESAWLGNGTPHRVQCPQGHLCQPTPGNISQGHGAAGSARAASGMRSTS